jgi:hypothetical protein
MKVHALHTTYCLLEMATNKETTIPVIWGQRKPKDLTHEDDSMFNFLP